MVQQDTGLVASLYNSAGKEIVLVSDGVSFKDPSAYPNVPKPHFTVSFEQAVALALLPFDSPSALWNAFPHPGPYPDDGPATIPALVKQWYGHDLLCPVDLDGNLTRPVLEACSIPHIKMIANSLGAPKRLTREKMIKFILEHHETAAVGRVEAARTRPIAARKCEPMRCHTRSLGLS
jgi:hypothetical protein